MKMFFAFDVLTIYLNQNEILEKYKNVFFTLSWNGFDF